MQVLNTYAVFLIIRVYFNYYKVETISYHKLSIKLINYYLLLDICCDQRLNLINLNKKTIMLEKL